MDISITQLLLVTDLQCLPPNECEKSYQIQLVHTANSSTKPQNRSLLPNMAINHSENCLFYIINYVLTASNAKICQNQFLALMWILVTNNNVRNIEGSSEDYGRHEPPSRILGLSVTSNVSVINLSSNVSVINMSNIYFDVIRDKYCKYMTIPR